MKKRILSIMLAICMVLTLVPATSFAAAGTSSTPSVSAYATKAQLMDDTFAPNSSGTAANIGKLVFGKKSDVVTPQEWYILGDDSGMTGENTILFAASPMVTGQVFNPSRDNITIANIPDNDTRYSLKESYDYTDNASPESVSSSHYGISSLRAALRNMETSNFTTAEQGMMNATTVTTQDELNRDGSSNIRYYTTTDKLYALSAEKLRDTTINAGSHNQKVLARDSYWDGGDEYFWLRSPLESSVDVLKASTKYDILYGTVNDYNVGIRPALNIKLENVLFASSAVAAPSASGTGDELLPIVYGRINKESNAEPQAMTLRMDGSGKSIGTVTYDSLNGEITARKSAEDGTVALVVQGKDGSDDWYYSEVITEPKTVYASTIRSALNLSAAIDLSTCKIWLETKAEDGMIYAVNASQVIRKTYFTYADKDQLMDGTFAPDANGNATDICKLAFGKNSSGQPQEWYVLKKDTGVAGENTIIFAANPIISGQIFNSSINDKPYEYKAGTGYGNNKGSIQVYTNHYGASELRAALNGMVSNTSYFTTAEQGMMNATTVKTADIKNNLYYTTTDKLYALQGVINETKVRAGRDDQIALAMDSYWDRGDGVFWLRSPYSNPTNPNNGVLVSKLGDNVTGYYVIYMGQWVADVRPAGNLNLSSVLFASAATAATSSSETSSGIIKQGKAMTLRLDGSGKNIGYVIYNTTTGDIKATKGSTTGNVSLVVQCNDGTSDWYYSKNIDNKDTVKKADIEDALQLSSVDLSSCKIWLEITGGDGMIYAVEAGKEIERINTTYATKEQLMNSFKPYIDGTAANIGKLAFGKNSSRQVQEWYILGKDSGVAGENTILFATSPIATGQVFQNGLLKQDEEIYNANADLSDCSYGGGTISKVHLNHYGASELRDKLQAMASSTSYFTTAEQGMMNATTVTTEDTGNNNRTYTTTDKLYALEAGGFDPSFGTIYTTIKAGSSNQIVLAMDSYWRNEKVGIWLRSPVNQINQKGLHKSCLALYADTGKLANYSGVSYNTVIFEGDIQPAANLNLSSVSFASAATAASYSTQETHGTIASGTAMTLRLDGRNKNIGTVNYNAAEGTIEINRGYTSMPVALMVQGSDGVNNWYYSKYIEYGYDKTKLVNVSDIEKALNLSPDSHIDLSSCKVWLESYNNPRDRGNGMIYAINAGDTPINSDTYTPPAESVIVQDDENATTSANLSNKILISDRMATLTVEPSVANKILSKAVENKSKKIVIDALSKNKTEAASTVVAQVDVPKMLLEALAATTEANVNFKTNVAEVTMDNAAAGAVAKQAAGDTVQLIVKKVDETADKVEFQLKVVCSNGKEIHDFKGGKAAVTVSIPETMASKEIVCVYIDDNGSMSKVTLQKNADGTYTFFTGHFSTYALMTAEEADEAIAAQKKETLAALADQKLTARSKIVAMKNGKKAVKITWYNKKGKIMDFDGVEIYRSTKKNSGYGKKPISTSATGKYYNTAIKSGTRYYYRVRGFVIIDGQKYYTDYSLKAIRTVK